MQTTELVHFEAARHALALATKIDEVKQIRDKAEALRQYIRQQGASLEMQNQAAEIKLRAERRAGELLKEQVKTGNPQLFHDETIGLENLGITRTQSHRWQAAASVPEEKFEQYITQTKANKDELTSVGLYNIAKAENLQARKENQKEAFIQADQSTVTLKHGDFRDLIKSVPDNSIDLILTDPPYPAEYLPLWGDMAKEAARVLKPGSFLITYSGQKYLPQVLNSLCQHLEYYWFGMLYHKGSIAQRFEVNMWNRAKPILFFYKPPKTKQTTWIEDIFESPQPEKDYHTWGQSIEPFKKLIECFSSPGQVVLEPFAGGGSTIRACIETKRNVIAYEIETDVYNDLKKRFNL